MLSVQIKRGCVPDDCIAPHKLRGAILLGFSGPPSPSAVRENAGEYTRTELSRFSGLFL